MAVLGTLPLIEERQTALDALKCLDALAFESDEHALRIVIRAATDLIRLAMTLADDLRRLDLCGLGQLALLDEECGLLLGAGEDALGLFLGALDDALGLLVDALRCTHLFGHGDTQLIEKIQGACLVDDHVAGQGHVAALRDQPLELFDEKDDVHGSPFPRGSTGVVAVVGDPVSRSIVRRAT